MAISNLLKQTQWFSQLTKMAAGEDSLFRNIYSKLQQLIKEQSNAYIKNKLTLLSNKFAELSTIKELIDEYQQNLAEIKSKIPANTEQGRAQLEIEKSKVFSEIKENYSYESDIQSYEEIFENINLLYNDILSIIQELSAELSPAKQTSQNPIEMTDTWSVLEEIPDALSSLVNLIPEEIIDTNAIQQQFQEAGEKGEFFDLSLNVGKKDTDNIDALRQAKEFKERKIKTFDEMKRAIKRNREWWQSVKDRMEKDPSLKQFYLEKERKNQQRMYYEMDEKADALELDKVLEQAKAKPNPKKIKELTDLIEETKGLSAIRKRDRSGAIGRGKKFLENLNLTTQNTIRKTLAIFNKKKNDIKASLKTEHHGIKGPFKSQLDEIRFEEMNNTNVARSIIRAIDNSADIQSLSPNDFSVIEISIDDKKKEIDFKNKFLSLYEGLSTNIKTAVIYKSKYIAAYQLVASMQIQNDTKLEKVKASLKKYDELYKRALQDVYSEINYIMETVSEFRKLPQAYPGMEDYTQRLETVITEIYPIIDEVYRAYASADVGDMKKAYDLSLEPLIGKEGNVLPILNGLLHLSTEAAKQPVLHQKLRSMSIMMELNALIAATKDTINLLQQMSGEEVSEKVIILSDNLNDKVPGMDITLLDALKGINAKDQELIEMFKEPAIKKQLLLLKDKYSKLASKNVKDKSLLDTAMLLLSALGKLR
jgi:hypothetical protein